MWEWHIQLCKKRDESILQHLIICDFHQLFGSWKDNEIVDGRWVFPNGTYYEGGFANCKPNGKGKWVFKDGNVVTGFFKQDKAEVGEDEDE